MLKHIAHRFLVEAWGAGKLALLDEYIAPVYLHNPASPSCVVGPNGMKQHIVRWRTAFPDLQITIEDQLVEGDKVMTRWRATGTYQNTIAGMAADGKRVNWHCVTLYRFVDNKLVESWMFTHMHDLVERLATLAAKWEQPF